MVDGTFQFAVVGDLHSAWDWTDVEFFSRSEYEAVWFTGDLGSGGSGDGVRVAAAIASIRKKVVVVPGNNDAADYTRILAELAFQRGKQVLLAGVSGEVDGKYHTWLGGYSSHSFDTPRGGITVIVGRPFAMGGSELSFVSQLRTHFGVDTPEASNARLRQLVDEAPTEEIVFLAHNGPTGLGDQVVDMFGRDFHPAGGDWGDDDLRDVITYAGLAGRRVLAVIAGHMHYRPLEQPGRIWQRTRDDILYVNAACVPRHCHLKGERHRHHIALRFDETGVVAKTVWV